MGNQSQSFSRVKDVMFQTAKKPAVKPVSPVKKPAAKKESSSSDDSSSDEDEAPAKKPAAPVKKPVKIVTVMTIS